MVTAVLSLFLHSFVWTDSARPGPPEPARMQLPGAPYNPADPRWAELKRNRAQDPQWEWKRPISFYGRVLDQDSQPVANASVYFSWNDTSPEGTSSLQTTSDADGYFSLIGKQGRGMLVRVWKPYHYFPKQRTSFDYAQFWDSNYHEANPQQPVVFRLRRMGAGTPLLMGNVRPVLPTDGTPVRINVCGGAEGTPLCELELTATPSTERYPPQRFTWSASISVPDGGLVEHRDEFPFYAPEEGYLPAAHFDMPPDAPDWQRLIEKDYYVRFGTPAKYARIHIRISGTNAKPTIAFAVNPTGSRTLEPALTQLSTELLNGSPPLQ